jgi:putative membrane protein
MLGFGMGFGVLGVVIMLIFWIGLIFLSVWIIRTLFQGSNNTASNKDRELTDPKKILDRRYSRGEITREQYELMKQDIS